MLVILNVIKIRTVVLVSLGVLGLSVVEVVVEGLSVVVVVVVAVVLGLGVLC
jgi:hypothetical protein